MSFGSNDVTTRGSSTGGSQTRSSSKSAYEVTRCSVCVAFSTPSASPTPTLGRHQVAGQLEMAVVLRELLEHVQQDAARGPADGRADVVVGRVAAQRHVEIDRLQV